MKVYLDTEFNSVGGELISLALVARGRYFYAVLPLPEVVDPWVAEHVLPKLIVANPGLFETKAHLALAIKQWLDQLDDGYGIELIADCADDFAHFFSLFRFGTYQHVTGARNDLCPYSMHTSLVDSGDLDEHRDAFHAHNAYYDALALMRWDAKRKRGPGGLSS